MKKEIQQLFWCKEEDKDLIDMMLQSNRRYTILIGRLLVLSSASVLFGICLCQVHKQSIQIVFS